VRKVLVIGLLVCLLLTGCGQPAEPKKVSFMVFGDPAELAAYQKLVEAFQARYPQIQIDLRHVASQSDYQQQLVTAFSAGAAPDVMLLNYRRVPQFAGPGGLEPIGPYVAKSTLIHEADFYQPAITAFRWNGQLWCIPQNASSLVVYYNRALFDAAGLPYPASDWTRDDFLQAAQALTRDLDGDGQTDQYGVGVEPSLIRLAPFIWQDGGELVDDSARPTRLILDSPGALAAFQWFVNLQVKEHVAPDAVAEQAEDIESRFLNGRLGMYLDSRRFTPTMRTTATFPWDVAPLPRSVQAAGILHSDGFCMAASAADKDAAWTFIEFANSTAGQEVLATTGRTVPSLRQVAESPAFLDPAQPPAGSRVFLDVIPTLRAVPLVTTWPQIEETANREIERAFYGQASVEEAAATAVSLTQPYFSQAGANP
jgi:multiple sugar transport system substrate-binding protein